MANVKKATREEVRKAIVARREARKAEKSAQYAKMRECAKSPAKFAAVLDDLVVKTARQAQSMSNLRDNLGLKRLGKEAPTRARISASRNYSRGFIRIAEEKPDVLADALCEAYKALDEQASAMEIAAEALGIDLGAAPAGDAFTGEGKAELEQGDESGIPNFENKAPDFGGEDEAEPKKEEAEPKEDEPEEKEAGASDPFVTDRSQDGAPKIPAKAVAPQAQGQPSRVDSVAQGKTGTRAKHCPECKYPGNTVEPETGECRHCKKKVMEPFDKQAAMSKKDFIALADAIKNMSVGPDEKRNIADGLCDTLRASNPRFMKDRFMGYVMGENGPSGGSVKPAPTPRPAKTTAPISTEPFDSAAPEMSRKRY